MDGQDATTELPDNMNSGNWNHVLHYSNWPAQPVRVSTRLLHSLKLSSGIYPYAICNSVYIAIKHRFSGFRSFLVFKAPKCHPRAANFSLESNGVCSEWLSKPGLAHWLATFTWHPRVSSLGDFIVFVSIISAFI